MPRVVREAENSPQRPPSPVSDRPEATTRVPVFEPIVEALDALVLGPRDAPATPWTSGTPRLLGASARPGPSLEAPRPGDVGAMDHAEPTRAHGGVSPPEFSQRRAESHRLFYAFEFSLRRRDVVQIAHQISKVFEQTDPKPPAELIAAVPQMACFSSDFSPLLPSVLESIYASFADVVAIFPHQRALKQVELLDFHVELSFELSEEGGSEEDVMVQFFDHLQLLGPSPQPRQSEELVQHAPAQFSSLTGLNVAAKELHNQRCPISLEPLIGRERIIAVPAQKVWSFFDYDYFMRHWLSRRTNPLNHQLVTFRAMRRVVVSFDPEASEKLGGS